jgi:flagellar P-ring protein FlgI
MGYGMVVGLQGTGDSRNSILTSQSMANILEKFGLNPSQKDFAAKNCAAVMVTANLSPIVRVGDKVDVGISSIGDAKSLQGGTLLMTALYAGNQKIYANAQGPVSVGGYYAAIQNQSIKKNVTTAGVISNGAIVEKNVDAVFMKEKQLVFTLNQNDFILASQVIKCLNDHFGANTAKSINGADVEITIPDNYSNSAVDFIAEALALKINHEGRSRVVVDERTGTVVVGGDVKISKVAITHGGLHIAIAGETVVSQPNSFSQGRSVVAENLSIRTDEAKSQLVVLPGNATIEQLVQALNAVNTLPRDVIVILENLKAVGALHAEIVVR